MNFTGGETEIQERFRNLSKQINAVTNVSEPSSNSYPPPVEKSPIPVPGPSSATHGKCGLCFPYRTLGSAG